MAALVPGTRWARAAAKYVDAFMQNIRRDNVSRPQQRRAT
jgi:hypothetical protein